MPSPDRSTAEETSDVGRLADVLQTVVGDADEPDGQGHGRVPAPIDDPVQVSVGRIVRTVTAGRRSANQCVNWSMNTSELSNLQSTR